MMPTKKNMTVMVTSNRNASFIQQFPPPIKEGPLRSFFPGDLEEDWYYPDMVHFPAIQTPSIEQA